MVRNTSGIADIAEGGAAGKTDLKEYGTNLIGISGCMVLLVDSGYAIVSVGFKRQVLRRGMAALLFYDDTFWVERSSRTFACRYVSLSYDNVEDAVYKLNSPYFWDSLLDMHAFPADGKQWDRLGEWYRQTEWICNEASREYRNTMLRNNIYNLFMALDSEMERGGSIVREVMSHGRSLMFRFLKLLSQYGRQTRSVAFYADRLHITTTYLNKLSHQWWNASPKELIDQQAVSEIKTLLATTDLSVKQIATALHFDDVPYMCRYFRRIAGVSPLEYRNGVEKS